MFHSILSLALVSTSIAADPVSPADVTAAFQGLLADSALQTLAREELIGQIRVNAPVAVVGGYLVIPVVLEDVFEIPEVREGLGAKLDVSFDSNVLDPEQSIGLALIPPQLAREIGAQWLDRYLDIALDAMEGGVTDILGIDDAAIGIGIAIFAIGGASYYVFKTLFPETDPRANCTGSSTDCDGDGKSDATDNNDDGDNYTDDNDNYPFDKTRHICDLCGRGASSKLSFSFFVDPAIADEVTELTVGLIDSNLGLQPTALGALDTIEMSFFAP